VKISNGGQLIDVCIANDPVIPAGKSGLPLEALRSFGVQGSIEMLGRISHRRPMGTNDVCVVNAPPVGVCPHNTGLPLEARRSLGLQASLV
jgi:hypothetical protein